MSFISSYTWSAVPSEAEWDVRIGKVYSTQMIIIVVQCNTCHTWHGILFFDKLNFYNQSSIFLIHVNTFLCIVMWEYRILNVMFPNPKVKGHMAQLLCVSVVVWFLGQCWLYPLNQRSCGIQLKKKIPIAHTLSILGIVVHLNTKQNLYEVPEWVKFVEFNCDIPLCRHIKCNISVYNGVRTHQIRQVV
jgi:hypothetical protein